MAANATPPTNAATKIAANQTRPASRGTTTSGSNQQIVPGPGRPEDGTSAEPIVLRAPFAESLVTGRSISLPLRAGIEASAPQDLCAPAGTLLLEPATLTAR